MAGKLHVADCIVPKTVVPLQSCLAATGQLTGWDALLEWDVDDISDLVMKEVEGDEKGVDGSVEESPFVLEGDKMRLRRPLHQSEIDGLILKEVSKLFRCDIVELKKVMATIRAQPGLVQTKDGLHVMKDPMADMPYHPPAIKCKCGSFDLVTDWSGGDTVCSTCGLVCASRILGTGATQRSFAEDGESTDHHSVSAWGHQGAVLFQRGPNGINSSDVHREQSLESGKHNMYDPLDTSEKQHMLDMLPRRYSDAARQKAMRMYISRRATFNKLPVATIGACIAIAALEESELEGTVSFPCKTCHQRLPSRAAQEAHCKPRTKCKAPVRPKKRQRTKWLDFGIE